MTAQFARRPLVASDKESEVVGVTPRRSLPTAPPPPRPDEDTTARRELAGAGEATDAVDHDGAAGARARGVAAPAREDGDTITETLRRKTSRPTSSPFFASAAQSDALSSRLPSRRASTPRPSATPELPRASSWVRSKTTSCLASRQRRCASRKATSSRSSLRGSADPTATTRRNRCRR